MFYLHMNLFLKLVLLGVPENLSAMLEMIFSPVIVQRHTQGTVHDELCRQGVKFWKQRDTKQETSEVAVIKGVM